MNRNFGEFHCLSEDYGGKLNLKFSMKFFEGFYDKSFIRFSTLTHYNLFDKSTELLACSSIACDWKKIS